MHERPLPVVDVVVLHSVQYMSKLQAIERNQQQLLKRWNERRNFVARVAPCTRAYILQTLTNSSSVAGVQKSISCLTREKPPRGIPTWMSMA